MISLYYFFYDFFLDAPSFGTVILRSVKIYFVAIALFLLCMLMDISAECAAIIALCSMFLPALLVYQYFRQRSRPD